MKLPWLFQLPLLLLALAWHAGAVHAQHVLTQRSRDVTLGRMWNVEQGTALDARLDFGFGKDDPVFRSDVAALYTVHPDRAYRRRFSDWHRGVLASYTFGGALDADGSNRRGAFLARPFLLMPIRTGELLFSLGVGYSTGRSCHAASDEACARNLNNRARAALARPTDLADLLPRGTVLRTLVSYKIDYGVLSLRVDGGYDRVFRSESNALPDATNLYQALGIAVSTTRFSVLIDQAFTLGACNDLWGSVGRAGICWGRGSADFRRLTLVSVGTRIIISRHLQWVTYAALPLPYHRFAFAGTTFEFPF